MADKHPVRLDKAALERIIQRASELQTGSRDFGEDLTADEILKLGKDVGIDEGYLQQAILEEQTRTEPEAGGFWSKLVGPGVVTAQRVVQGDVEDVSAQLARWIEENELLVIQRQQPGRLSWEPIGGFQAMMRRSTAMLGGGKRPFMLSRVDGLSAAIVQLEPGYCNVILTASVKKVRAGYIGGMATMWTAAGVGAVILAAMSPFLWIALAPIPFGIGGAWVVARQYPPIAERARLGLECVLDHLERGAAKPSHQLPTRTPGLLGLLTDEVKKVIKPDNRVSQ